MKNYFDFFDNVSSEEIELDDEILESIWNGILPEEAGVDVWDGKTIFIEGVKQLSSGESELLYLKTNGWKVHIKKNLIKTILVSPAIGGILYSLGYIELAPAVLPAVIPLLFDIENVELSRKEEEILIHLPVHPDKKKYKTAEKWYESLPKDVRKQINEYDFKDFMEKLVLAGYAQEAEKGRYRIFQKDKNIFKIKFD